MTQSPYKCHKPHMNYKKKRIGRKTKVKDALMISAM